MEDDAGNDCGFVKQKSSQKKNLPVSKYRRHHRNTVRKVRRKQSKVRYYKSLKQLRYNRKTDDLCSAVEVFDITDMEWAPASSSTALPIEVAEWQTKEQIAYWKSRAISLEFENRMLHQHLRNVYAKTIEQYSQNKYTESSNEELENQRGDTENERSKEITKQKTNTASGSKRPISPREPVGKNRFEEMKKIYGDKAQKIMGMETALQLNYEKHLDKLKPSHWPSIPLRLKFD